MRINQGLLYFELAPTREAHHADTRLVFVQNETVCKLLVNKSFIFILLAVVVSCLSICPLRRKDADENEYEIARK